tara:strand:+ start:1331 stop:1534 length:204 start_codon:yes stop_codon:yes gene_type:complete
LVPLALGASRDVGALGDVLSVPQALLLRLALFVPQVRLALLPGRCPRLVRSGAYLRLAWHRAWRAWS